MVKQGVSASEVLRMFTLRESAKELGKSEGGGLGAGFMLPQMAAQMPPQQSQDTEKKEDPLHALKMRFAKGEITEKIYEKMKKVLEG